MTDRGAIAVDRVQILVVLLGIVVRLGCYCSGCGSDLEAIALDRVPIMMVLLMIRFRLGCYCLG